MTQSPDDPLNGEAAIIQQYLAPLAAGFPGAFGLLDDCAAITPAPGHDIIVKTDPVAAGIHFLPDDRPEDIAWKALAVNVSDLVAKTAVPRAYLMALSFPAAPTRDWMHRFASGLAEAQSAFGMHLIGGDTDRRPGPVTISITVFGEVPCGRMLRRGTAKAGDLVCVSGCLGDAALGLALRKGDLQPSLIGLSHGEADGLIAAYLRPRPDPRLIPALRDHARAAMDISDGLVKDLGRMCSASGVGARVTADRIPVSAAAAIVFRARPDLLPSALTAGDDYKILCAVPPDRFAALASMTPGGFTRIGTFVPGAGVEVTRPDGSPWPIEASGWDHF